MKSLLVALLVSFSCTSFGATLQELSSQMNKTLPEVYDPVTKLQKTSVENNNFYYHFLLDANQREYDRALPNVKRALQKSACGSSKDRRILLQHKANIVYRYENVKGEFLGEFMLKPDQCRK